MPQEYLGGAVTCTLAWTVFPCQRFRCRILRPFHPTDRADADRLHLEAIERELALQTLARCHGNRTHAARVLGFRCARCGSPAVRD